MITITQVKRTEGQVVLTIEYSMGEGTEVLAVDAEQIVDRLKALRALLGRKSTLAEAKEVVVTLINEVRQGKQPLVEVVPWETFIGIDLEA